jgi:hypothetical protein
MFLGAIGAQIKGTQVLAMLTLLVLLAGGALWLAGTGGSPVVGVSFVALGLVLAFTVHAFIRVMRMLGGNR